MSTQPAFPKSPSNDTFDIPKPVPASPTGLANILLTDSRCFAILFLFFALSVHTAHLFSIIGFSDERAARAVFGAVFNEWAKVLMNGRYSEETAKSLTPDVMGLSMSSRRLPDKLSSSIDLLTDDQVKVLIDVAVSRNDVVGIRHNPGISWMPATARRIAPDAVAKKCDPHGRCPSAFQRSGALFLCTRKNHCQAVIRCGS
ncbi:uncharacterized protein EV420DRAFT_150978 [Desarmillaria tabescens]|uniref:Uncharacterized protein n=1 Tax=Armillaria tabescens TaxID=1929756 RepID=A0AA39MLJ0_ARMTA|nr:uncharacterized protein EV420DRAFT_150978 [Desarmillaria tabescens]KAK0438139.1 hypothetical protein EV420DRAFT_150978 [Desarmillaria tabescens]